MDYGQFKEELKSFVLQNEAWPIDEAHYKFYPDGFEAGADKKDLEFIRSTNIKYHQSESDTLIGDFVVLEQEQGSGNLISRFEIQYLYDEFTADGWERVRLIIDENLKLASRSDASDIMEHLDDYDYIKDKLFIRPINYTDNRYELKNIIYKQCGDIALVLYVLLYDDKDMGIGSAKIQKITFESWEKDMDEVWNDALINTNVMAPPRMYFDAMDTAHPPYEKGAFMALNSKIDHIGKMQAPVLTTTRQKNGAIALFYPGVQEKICALAGGSYYAAFTSIDEVRIHAEGSISPRTILSSLKEMNKKFNTAGDILSRKVYLYDSDKNILKQLEL